MLGNVDDIESGDLGSSLRSILQHKDIRGHFSSIHPDLTAVGVTKVQVTDEGLSFLRESEQGDWYNQLERN